MVDIYCPICYKEEERKAPCVAAIATDPSWYDEDLEKEKEFYKDNISHLIEMEKRQYDCPKCGHSFQTNRKESNFHVYGFIGNERYQKR